MASIALKNSGLSLSLTSQWNIFPFSVPTNKFSIVLSSSIVVTMLPLSWSVKLNVCVVGSSSASPKSSSDATSATKTRLPDAV